MNDQRWSLRARGPQCPRCKRWAYNVDRRRRLTDPRFTSIERSGVIVRVCVRCALGLIHDGWRHAV